MVISLAHRPVSYVPEPFSGLLCVVYNHPGSQQTVPNNGFIDFREKSKMAATYIGLGLRTSFW